MSEKPDFEARKKAMIARLAARRPAPKSTVTSTPAAIDEAEDLLKQAEKALQDATPPSAKLIASVENVLVTLPPGRMSRRLKETLNQLRQRFTKDSQASKPSFSFSRKPQAPVNPITTAKTESEEVEEAALVPPPNSFSLTKKNNIRELCEADDGTDVFLSEVEDSYLVLGFRSSTVHLSGVRNSTVVFLPVKTSILIRNCIGLTLVAAAQQIRIHDSTELNLHVSIRGAVIIERCSSVRVAPYKMASGLVETQELPENDKWADVQDFNWLVTTRPSPNWLKMNNEDWKEFDLQVPQ
ncbi:hypothetical protein QR680_012779 [Steinernema hermaphroditum]|uniref:C-CAP/cofactor C-like domain-containing protein n=1 Tax=Steinernema hermaphroditum TaxID=289476 RepID=A0AA39M1B8_9BILA|nr:hypothetical protein QR680_012779 [Steinernema hermaphroditum]